jgi:hypothetical protein
MQLLQATEISSGAGSAASTLVADGVAMPSAEMLLAVHGAAGITDAVATVAAAQSTSEVSRVLEDALSGGGEPIDALLQVLAGDAGSAPGPVEMAAFVAGAAAWDMHDHAGFMPTLGGNFLAMEAHLEVPTPL